MRVGGVLVSLAICSHSVSHVSAHQTTRQLSVLCANMDGEGLMSNTADSHQGAVLKFNADNRRF